jgi:pimeloyl-ACP methyl ester carboxylesterase
VIVGQQPYAIDPDGPLARTVGQALELSEERGIEALVKAFEGIAGRYPDPIRDAYLAADAAAMRVAFSAAMREGAVSQRLHEWRVRCLICVAADDMDFFDQARRAAAEIPGAEFVAIEGTDHLGMDTASIDPAWSAILRTLRATS